MPTATSVSPLSSLYSVSGYCLHLYSAIGVVSLIPDAPLPLTYMTIMDPDSVPVVFAVTFHGIVGEVTFCHFIIWINDNLMNKERYT